MGAKKSANQLTVRNENGVEFNIVGWEAKPSKRIHEGVKEGYIVIEPKILCVYVCQRCGTATERELDLGKEIAGSIWGTQLKCQDGCGGPFRGEEA